VILVGLNSGDCIGRLWCGSLRRYGDRLLGCRCLFWGWGRGTLTESRLADSWCARVRDGRDIPDQPIFHLTKTGEGNPSAPKICGRRKQEAKGDQVAPLAFRYTESSAVQRSLGRLLDTF
jgi:hypothetical protein